MENARGGEGFAAWGLKADGVLEKKGGKKDGKRGGRNLSNNCSRGRGGVATGRSVVSKQASRAPYQAKACKRRERHQLKKRKGRRDQGRGNESWYTFTAINREPGGQPFLEQETNGETLELAEDLGGKGSP